MIMYSTEGGMDIETVAENTPDLIFYEDIDPSLGYSLSKLGKWPLI